MTDPNGFEDALRDGLRASTEHVVAHEELQHRLVTSAAARTDQPLRSGFFRSTWVLAAAAAVITALAVGSVVFVSRQTQHSSVVSGNGTRLPAANSSAPLAPATSAEPTAASSSAPPTRPASSTHTAPASHALSGYPGPVESTSAGRSTVATSETPPPPRWPATCSTPAGGTANPTSLADFTRRIVGTWLVCSSPSALATSDAGLQISADGHWAKLVRDGAGRLVPGSGLLDSGTWKALDVSAENGRPAFQLNLMAGSSVYILLADFAAAVDRVQLDNNGDYVADYVPTTERVVPA